MSTQIKERFFTMSYPRQTTIDRIGGDIRRALRVRRNCQAPLQNLIAALSNGSAYDQDLKIWLSALRSQDKIAAHAYSDGHYLFERVRD